MDRFDPSYTQALGSEVLGLLAEHYFRLKLVGLEQVPDPTGDRPIIFVANHAGRAFPWDAILLNYAISTFWRYDLKLGVEIKPHSLIDPQLFKNRRNFPYRIPDWWFRTGCVEAGAANFMRLLAQKKHVIIFPEG